MNWLQKLDSIFEDHFETYDINSSQSSNPQISSTSEVVDDRDTCDDDHDRSNDDDDVNDVVKRYVEKQGQGVQGQK